MKPRIIFIHGNQATNWRFAWTPWLKHELDQYGFETVFETMPDSIIARAEYWLPFMQDFFKIGQNDVIVGWSSGAIAAMCYAETHHIKGSVLISPYHTELGDELEKQSGLFYGDDDPYIPQADFEYVSGHLQPEVHKIPGAKHFIERQEFPEVLDYIVNAYSGAENI